jgi:8-oxo-dGTP diphosphatase
LIIGQVSLFKDLNLIGKIDIFEAILSIDNTCQHIITKIQIIYIPMSTRHSVIPAVYLILQDKNGQYCLTRRYKTGYMDGFYSLPAGHLDGGESLIQAMIREAKEEVDILIRPEDFKLVHVSNNLFSNPERIDFFFMAKSWQGEVKINEPDKCDDILWADLDNLPDNIVTVVKIALLKSSVGEFYSEFWGE